MGWLLLLSLLATLHVLLVTAENKNDQGMTMSQDATLKKEENMTK